MKTKTSKPARHRRVNDPAATRLLSAAHECLPAMLQRLEQLVRIESPSDDKAAVNRAVSLVEGWCAQAGARVKRHKQRDYGDLLQATFAAPVRSGRKPLLLLGHLDTVWDLGTLASMPYTQTADRISGPGVLDMKAGVVMALAALGLATESGPLSRPVILLLHSEEEVGSPVSRALTEKVASKCEWVYVMEPAQGAQGAYKTARKGIGNYRLDVTGVAAHSGVDFTAGHSAIVEIAQQVGRISGLTDLEKGITVNPGVITGGTRSNVIAARAMVEIDVRIARARDAAPVERALHKLKAFDRHCRLELSGELNRPPMERTRAIGDLFTRAQREAAQLGITLEEASTGGGSDGNFTAALGVPTLDGMGAVGAGAHATHEHLLLEHLAPRTALLARLLMKA